MKITEYKTLVFDCDGVILNSNKVKKDAFYKAALPYGDKAAQALVEYHVARGGISRYKKFEWFLQQEFAQSPGPDMSQLLRAYADEVRIGLLTCEVVDGLHDLREQTSDANWLIVSGGDQKELQEVFSERGLACLFDGGIFGSPDTKDEILASGLGCGLIEKPALFFGDSKYDHIAASAADLDFVFLSYWTEFSGWESYCQQNNIISRNSLL